MTVEAATDREIFLAYLDHVLCPQLCPGDVVVMDNLSSHKVAGVRERIEAAGAESTLSAALLARPEPYRKGLVQTQTTASKCKSTNQGGARQSHHRTFTSNLFRQHSSLVPTSLWNSTE